MNEKVKLCPVARQIFLLGRLVRDLLNSSSYFEFDVVVVDVDTENVVSLSSDLISSIVLALYSRVLDIGIKVSFVNSCSSSNVTSYWVLFRSELAISP